MLYLATASGPLVRSAMDAGVLGFMATPGTNRLREGWAWAADNGCFSDRWDAGRWWAMLERYADRPRCLFAVCPDVVADAEATNQRWRRWAEDIRDLGYPVAYVTQDGASARTVPWGELDVLFTGGSTAWKVSPEAQRLAHEAQDRGKPTHMGRVNTLRRLRFAFAHGYASVDGTLLARGPDVNLPRLLRFLEYAHQSLLFDGRSA